jgi:hypothetical protein
MKQIVLLKAGEKTLYEGRISDLPYLQEAIVQKSIELFGDDNPCIIHQSYVIKEFSDQLLTLLNKENPLHLSQHENINFIDTFEEKDITLELKKS